MDKKYSKIVKQSLLVSMLSLGLVYSQDIQVSAEAVENTEHIQDPSVAAPFNNTQELNQPAELDGTIQSSSALEKKVESASNPQGEEEFPETSVKRLSGSNRYSNAAEISQSGWEQADTVIVANGDVFADALTGTTLSKKHDAPILLTRPEELHDATQNEINRLGAKKVILLGGETSVSKSIEDNLVSSKLETQRFSGKDRYEVAANIAKDIMSDQSSRHEVFLVNGDTYADALSIAPIAASKQIPVLMTRSNTLHSSVKSLLHRINKVTIVGGTTSISKAIENELKTSGLTVERLDGSNRYAVNRKVMEKYGIPGEEVYVASGEIYTDALPTAALATKENKAMLLVKSDNVKEGQNQLDFIYNKHGNTDFIIIGGINTISKQTENWFKNPESLLGSKNKDERSGLLAEYEGLYYSLEDKESFLEIKDNVLFYPGFYYENAFRHGATVDIVTKLEYQSSKGNIYRALMIPTNGGIFKYSDLTLNLQDNLLSIYREGQRIQVYQKIAPNKMDPTVKQAIEDDSTNYHANLIKGAALGIVSPTEINTTALIINDYSDTTIRYPENSLIPKNMDATTINETIKLMWEHGVGFNFHEVEWAKVMSLLNYYPDDPHIINVYYKPAGTIVTHTSKKSAVFPMDTVQLTGQFGYQSLVTYAVHEGGKKLTVYDVPSHYHHQMPYDSEENYLYTKSIIDNAKTYNFEGFNKHDVLYILEKYEFELRNN